MADKAVALQAADLFSLGTGFEPQSSKVGNPAEFAQALDDIGDQAAKKTYADKVTYEATYHYVGTALGTDFTAKLAQVVNSIWIDRISIRFAQRQPIEISISGHNHTQNAHAAGSEGDFDGFDLDVDTLAGDVGPWDVPNNKPWSNSDADVALKSLEYVFEADHVDEDDHTGLHWVGRSMNGRVTATVTYTGVPTLTTTGWDILSDDDSDGNKAHDSNSTSGRKALARTVVPA